MHISTIFGEVISEQGVRPKAQKLKVLTEMPPPKTKKELQAFLRIINYLGKFPSGTEDICESLRKLTSTKTEWTWNAKNIQGRKINYKRRCIYKILQ